jgi:aromatic-L-amino-acid decarboxylase
MAISRLALPPWCGSSDQRRTWCRPRVGCTGYRSSTLDPHKGLFLAYGTGALLVRDGSTLRALHGMQAGYLPPAADEAFYDPAQHGPELSRGFPRLRAWLTIKTYGVVRLRATIAEKRALAVAAAERLAREPGIALVAPPQLSLLAFRLEPPGAPAAVRDEATRWLLDRVNARGRVMLTGSTVDGRFLARICVLSFRTRRRHAEAAVDQIVEEAAGLLAGEAV